MVAKVKRPAGQKDQKSFFSSRYFTVILTVGSLVLTGLVGGLFEYLGGQLAQNAATSADPPVSAAKATTKAARNKCSDPNCTELN